MDLLTEPSFLIGPAKLWVGYELADSDLLSINKVLLKLFIVDHCRPIFANASALNRIMSFPKQVQIGLSLINFCCDGNQKSNNAVRTF